MLKANIISEKDRVDTFFRLQGSRNGQESSKNTVEEQVRHRKETETNYREPAQFD